MVMTNLISRREDLNNFAVWDGNVFFFLNNYGLTSLNFYDMGDTCSSTIALWLNFIIVTRDSRIHTIWNKMI